MIGAIHRPQRRTRTPCSTRPSTPLGLKRVLIGLRLRCKRRVEQHVVDGEERRGERPVDDAGDQFGPEQPHPARDLAEVDHPVLVEDRIGGEVAERAAVEAVIDVGIGPELGDHDLELGANRNTIRARRRRSRRAGGPAHRGASFAASCARRSRRSRRRSQIDAAVAERADSGHRQKARAAVVGRKIGAISERQAQPGDDAARRSLADRDRRALSRPKNGGVPSALPMIVVSSGKRTAPPSGPTMQRVRGRGSPRAGRAQDERRNKDEAHEQRAVDRAFDEARAPMLPDSSRTRGGRPPSQSSTTPVIR